MRKTMNTSPLGGMFQSVSRPGLESIVLGREYKGPLIFHFIFCLLETPLAREGGWESGCGASELEPHSPSGLRLGNMGTER